MPYDFKKGVGLRARLKSLGKNQLGFSLPKWTDVRDTITAPIRATTGFASDLFSGKNVFESTGRLITKELAALQGPQALAINSLGIESTLKKISPYTLGLGGEIADTNKFAYELNTGKREATRSASLQYFRQTTEATAKVAAVAFGGAALGGGLAGYGGAVAGTGAFEKILNGDLAGGLDQGLSTFAPGEYGTFKDVREAGKDIFGGNPESGSQAIGGQGPSQSAFSGDFGPTGKSIPIGIVVAVVAAGAFFLLRGKK